MNAEAATTMTMPERERFDEGRHQGVAEAEQAVEPLLTAAVRSDDVGVEVAARMA